MVRLYAFPLPSIQEQLQIVQEIESRLSVCDNILANIDEGLEKAEALRQAKLRYLASADMDARKLPFHWAAFTLTGMDGRVKVEGGGRWWVWGLGLALLSLAWLWLKRRRG